MRTRDRVTSACQRWWLWTTVTGDVVTQGQSSQGRRGAGVHGSTPYQRLATSAVSVALAKAAQAGFPRRGSRARASLGAALDAGRTTSNVIQDIDPCAVSKVLRPRLPRTSRCGFGRRMAVKVGRNHACLQLLLRLARVAAALAPAEAAPRARCLCSGDVRNSGEGPARPRRCAEACRATHLRARRSSGALASQMFLLPRMLRCFRRNSAPLYCVCASVAEFLEPRIPQLLRMIRFARACQTEALRSSWSQGYRNCCA